jgi:hypothetical protein
MDGTPELVVKSSGLTTIRLLAIIKESSGSNSAVECDLAKVEVAGSNPVSRSRILSPAMPAAEAHIAGCFQIRRDTQVEPFWRRLSRQAKS